MKNVLTMRKETIMKQFTKYICAFLMMVGMSVNAWGTTENISFATCEWGFPAGTAGFGYFSYDGYKIYAEDVRVGYLSPNYYGVMLEKNKSAHILLPSIPGTISSIVVTAYSGASASANLSLYVDGVIVGSAKNIGNTSASWTGLSIPANAVVKLQNDDDSDGKLTQITGVTITHNGSKVGGTSSSIPDGNYEIEAMPAVYGQGTATSNVAYSEAYETVTFTATPTSGYIFSYWEITYVSSCINSDLGVYSWIDESTDAICRITMPAGKVTATAYFEESDCTTQGVIVSDESVEDSKIGYYGTVTSFDLTYMSDGSGAVTWSSTNTDVATVVGDGGDGATVTVVGAGSANIVATVAEDATYCEGEGFYELLIEPIAPTVTNFTASCTNNAITITNENSSTVSNKGGLAITRYGYLYSTSVSTPTFGASGVNDANVGTSDVTLNARWVEKNITGLSAGTTYYVRAYAYNGEEYGYSTVVTITTKCAVTYVGNGGTGTTIDASSPYDKLSDVTVMANSFVAPDGKIFDYWAGSDSKNYNPGDEISDITTDITLTAQWRAVSLSDAKFSCADWSVTGPSGDIVFITSSASKTVRSQEAFHVSASGLPASTALTFTTFPVNSKFAFKKADGTAVTTDSYGAVNTDFYVFYTPGEGDTSDGLDEINKLYLSVEGEPRKDTLETKRIIGRHLPADFVIAGKKDNKWYALPSNMASTSTPAPSEIAVDDINNPSIAYTAATNIYGLEGPVASNISGGNGQYVRLTMSIESSTGSGKPAPLFGTSGSEDASNSPKVGKSGTAIATNPLSEGWWWSLTQTNTSITNPQDAKYTIKCANNNHTLSIKNSPFVWGLYASGEEELRLIPASDIPFTEAYFVEWGQHGGVIEVDATGIDATSVIAHLGEATSSAITLSQTGTSGGKSSKYNYTVNFGDGIDFAASTSNGAMLTLEWKNGKTVKAISNIVVPKIIASSATMKSIMSGDAQWETEVHVLPDVTLTANAGDFESNDVMIKQLEIYPGATVVVTKGAAGSGTLKVKTLVLRNGWTCASGTRKYDVARLYITPSTASLAKNAIGDVWYMDWYIDYDQYYPIAVPWKVAVNSSNIVHRYTSNTATFGPSGSIRLRYYDGEQRATSGQSMIGQNWKDYGKSGNENLPDYLEPSKGYSFSAKRPSGKAFSIVRMTLGIPSNDWTALGEQGEVSGTHKDQVSVTGWGKGTADWYAMGWNFIGNPYMCTFNGDDAGISGKLELQNGGSIKYATIPSIDFSNYDQVAIADADLNPARGFFIQANNAEAQNITFNASKIVDPTAAPARYMTQTEAIPEQEAYIRLSYEGGKDQMGLIIGEDYTEAYEVNADLAKVLGDAGFVKTYMQYGGMDMAYVAINQELAKAWIPVTVILPKDGEYTFSLMSSSEVEQLEGVYLIDYAENETVTNLIDKDYTFVADAATISNRFAINAIIGERQTPTDIDVINEGGDLNSDRPFKFLYRDKVYIYHRGVIYDATGKKVREINK